MWSYAHRERNFEGVEMKKIYLIIIILLICLLYTACIPEFINPLSEPQNTKIDQNLLGTWFTKSKKECAFIHFEVNKENSSLLNVELKSINNKDKSIEITLFSIFTTKGKDKQFMNIKESKDGKLSDYYNIARYELKNNKLKIYTIDETRLEKAIENNAILGTSKKGRMFYYIQITDIGSNTLNLLENNDMFTLLAEFQKV
jgi:hypothetical protein